MQPKKKIWYCKIGQCEESDFENFNGMDLPMRAAISRMYRDLTGKDPEFLFSGWGAELTEAELAVVENRLPNEKTS